MEVRNNVRQRRRQRIQQLTGVRPAGSEELGRRSPYPSGGERDEPIGQGAGLGGEEDVWESVPAAKETREFGAAPENRRTSARTQAPAAPASPSAASDYGAFEAQKGAAYGTPYEAPYAPPREEPDPEQWWKEKQRQERGYPPGRRPSPSGGQEASAPGGPQDGGARPAGTGRIGSLSNLSPYGGLSERPGWDDTPPYGSGGTAGSRFVKGFMARTVIAAALFGAVWAWTNWDLPGSEEVHGWTIRTVTEDMNFAAVEAWYERTFGGTPSYLPIFEDENKTQAVSADWSREDAVPPLTGRMVQSFAQSGTDIRLAAQAGTPVKSIHTGRVTQVTLDDQGLATIKIQHSNDIVSVYSKIAKPAVKVNDWVETGRPLGEVASGAGGSKGEGTLEFAVQQDGKPIDPAGVVPLD